MLLKHYALIAVLFSLFVFMSYLYYGATNPPLLGDSHDYHMPIAERILQGQIFYIPNTVSPFINYPGASEAILSLFILFHIPVNWFCLLGWVFLWFSLKKLAEHFGVESNLAIIYAAAFTACLSVLRQTFTQSIDMWMAVWFVLSILFLEKPKKTSWYFFILGILFGMILGSKYSGILYLAVFLVVYGKNLFAYLSLKHLLIFLVPFCILGLSWYVRNYINWGNPLYPGYFLIFSGYPPLKVFEKLVLWRTPFENNGWGFYRIIEALVSEYLIWGLSFIPMIAYGLLAIKERILWTMTPLHRVFFLGVLTSLVSLILPIPTLHIISNMRYLFPVILLFMLFIFLLVQKYKQTEFLAILALLNMITATSYIIYHPKLILIYLFIVSVLLYKRKVTLEKLIRWRK